MSDEKTKDDDAIEFELSEEELEAIAKNKSKVVANLEPPKKTPFTIENAPMAKSIIPNFQRLELTPKLLETEEAPEADEDPKE